MKEIELGSVVIAERDTNRCAKGELGVCYQVFGDGGPHYSIIFESGHYKDFSREEADEFLTNTRKVCSSIQDYDYTFARRLVKDFEAGRFSEAFDRRP